MKERLHGNNLEEFSYYAQRDILEARIQLAHQSEGETSRDQRTLPERATDSLGFLIRLSRRPHIRHYLEMTDKKIKIAESRASTGPIVVYVNHKGVRVAFDGEYSSWEEAEGNSLTENELANMWEQKQGAGIVKKLAKLTPDKILDKFKTAVTQR